MKSDTELRAEVRAEIERQREGRANDVDAQVDQGVVTLTGSVQDDAQRWHLRDAISALPGVGRLIDETMNVPDTSLRLPDADVARPWFPTD